MPNKLCPACHKPVPKGQSGGSCGVWTTLNDVAIELRFKIDFLKPSEKDVYLCNECIDKAIKKLKILAPKD